MKCRHETPCSKRCLLGTGEIEPCRGYDKCKDFQPNYTTNADRVRAMSDEELAAFLAKFDSHCRVCPADDICGGYSTTPPRDCAYWLEEWLKHPAEEVDDG